MVTAHYTSFRDAPFREAEFMPVALDVERRDDGTVILRSRIALGDYEANLPLAFAKTAARCGDKPALAVRSFDGSWDYTSYAALKIAVDAATKWLIDNVPRGRAMLVMAPNGVAAATLTFAAYAAGVVLCPVSTAFGLAGGDYTRLRHVIAKTRPALIYVDRDPKLAAAIAACAGDDIAIVTPDTNLFSRKATSLSRVLATKPTAAVARAIAAIDPGDVVSYMLTSGSTGLPKVVPQTMAATAACGQQGLIAIGQAADWGGVIVDWLPWHHVAGASVLRSTLVQGGTLYVDGGKPVRGLFDETIRNLREIPIAYFSNVPLGYAMLVEAMEHDEVLRRTFFSKMRLMLYGGAGLPQHVFDRLQELAVAETGHRIHMTTGYGMTETVTGCMVIHFPTEQVGIGLPTPGLEVKLVPQDARHEVRLRGPNVMRGYLDEPEKNAEVFDDEGFYCTGDLAVFHDPGKPEAGLAFAGRQAEEFKLSNGTWVYGGQLRDALLKALAPLVGEIVLCDDSREFLTLLAWPAAGISADLLEQIVSRLREFNRGQQGGSATVRRVALLYQPPNVDAHEISDKGTINRRAVIDHRHAIVERLYVASPDADIGIV
jgi:feruloyl-CoA synthase